MATRFKQRREHRKLNKVRSFIWNFFLKRQGSRQLQPVVCVRHHRRLLKQQKLSWFCVKAISLLFSQFAVLPNNTNFLRHSQINSVIKTYLFKHRRVQELKAFYGGILNKVFKTFVLGRGFFYNKLSFFKHLNFIGSFKKVISKGSSLVSTLESRLVSVLWRGFFASSMVRAHKLVVFGKIKVNGLIVTKTSYLLDSGDSVVLVNHNNWFYRQFINNFDVWQSLSFRVLSSHLEISFVLSTIIFLYKPFDRELTFPFCPKLHFVRSFYLQ